MNKWIGLGRLGKDPELKHSKEGLAITSFSIAIDEWRNKAKHTEWVNVVCFQTTAENVVKYLSKGSQALIEGRMQTRKWQDKTGADRYTTEIVANTVQFVGSKTNKDESVTTGFEAQPAAQGGIDSDDIPW